MFVTDNPAYTADLLRPGNVFYTRDGKSISELLKHGRQLPELQLENASSENEDTTPSKKVNREKEKTSTEIDTDYLSTVKSGDKETAQRIPAEQTPWQEYLEWYTRKIGELTRRQFSPPEERETIWQRYLHQQEKEREIEKALKTVEILGTVPEEYAALLEEAPGTDALVALRHWEDRRRKDN